MWPLAPVIVLFATMSLSASSKAVSAGADTAWAAFHGPGGYSLNYPSNWPRIGSPSDGRLDILSPGERTEAVVIGPGQAEIEVRELPAGTSTRAELRRLASDGTPVRKEWRRGTPGGCGKLLSASYDLNDAPDEAPKVVERDNRLFCKIHGRLYVISLRYWRGDPNAAGHIAVEMQVARSIRAR